MLIISNGYGYAYIKYTEKANKEKQIEEIIKFINFINEETFSNDSIHFKIDNKNIENYINESGEVVIDCVKIYGTYSTSNIIRVYEKDSDFLNELKRRNIKNILAKIYYTEIKEEQRSIETDKTFIIEIDEEGIIKMQIKNGKEVEYTADNIKKNI